MQNTNKLLKISSILYLIISLLIITFDTLIGGIVLAVGITILSYSFLPIEDLKRKKVIILIIAILTFIFSKIIGILLFIAFDKISSDKTVSVVNKQDNISVENKRIDLLFKIGIGMILVSGILFATTSWNIISDFVKCLGLAFMGVIFLLLSNYTEKKLKLIKSAEVYYSLGLVFFLLTFIGIGIFGVISPWFSYIGEGKNLVYFGTFSILSSILFLIHKKYNKKEYHYLGYICCYLCLYHILAFMGLDLLVTTLIISAITLLLNIFVKNETLSSVSKLLSYLYWVVLVIEGVTDPNYIVIIASLINIGNIIYLIYKNDDSIDNILGIIIIYILLVNVICNIDFEFVSEFIFGIASIVYLFINFRKNNNKAFLITNQIIYNVLITIILLTMVGEATEVFIFSLLYGIINFIVSYLIKKPIKIDLYYQPTIIFMISMLFFNVLNLDVLAIYPIITSAIIYTLIHFLIKDETAKKVYFISLIIISILSALVNSASKELIPGILIIGLASYLYKITKSIWSYIFILFTILVFEIAVIEHLLSSTVSSLLVLLIFGALTYLLKGYQLRRVNLIALVIPLYSLVNNINNMPEIQTILYNIFGLYILFLIIKLFIKDLKSKDVVATIGTSLLTLNIIFNNSIIIGIYVGLIGLLIIFITYNKKAYKSYFYCGVVITILNIIIQLSEYWSKVPLWLYLLLAGLTIIGFVMHREIKKQKAPEIKEDNNIQNEQIANFCDQCGTKNFGGKYCIKCGNYLVLGKKESE